MQPILIISQKTPGNFYSIKKELKKLLKEVKNSGLTIIPLSLFLNDKGFAKLQIALSKGKKLHDKRETIKDRDTKRKLNRINKTFNT